MVIMVMASNDQPLPYCPFNKVASWQQWPLSSLAPPAPPATPPCSYHNMVDDTLVSISMVSPRPQSSHSANFWPSTWPFGGQNVPQSSNCAMSNRCHPPCFSTQIFRGSLLTRPQNKGRGQVVPQNRHFPLNLSSTCSSTCTISVPPRVHSIFHLPRVHSFSFAQPRTTHQFTIQPKYRRRRWY